MKKIKNILIAVITGSTTAIALSAVGVQHSGQHNVTVNPTVTCASLLGKTHFNVSVTSAVPIAASGALPEYCKVQGTENGTHHDIEIRLPTNWRERFVQQGGGGFDGKIPEVGSTNVALSAGAVQVANNGGHRDPSGAIFLNHPLVVQRYAHTAILTATLFGKAITADYYGHFPRFSYYQGCSNGGRGALNAAAKYGEEFDGVIAGAPTRNLVGQVEQWTRAAALTIPTPAKLSAVAAAAIAKCDALDGATDGIVSNWEACSFDPTIDVPASVGLSAAEASAVKALMTDLRLSDGRLVYSGFGVGDMSRWGTYYAALGVGHIRNIVLNQPTWAAAQFDKDALYDPISEAINSTYNFNASVAGLSQFLSEGKKIILWHGSDDALLSHKDTIRTWMEIVQSTSSQTVSQNTRLYIASGVNHCGGGPGADTFDLLTPMMNWVEREAAPDFVISKKVNPASGETIFSRPMCQYPTFPKYRGIGDVKSADSFVCSVN